MPIGFPVCSQVVLREILETRLLLITLMVRVMLTSLRKNPTITPTLSACMELGSGVCNTCSSVKAHTFPIMVTVQLEQVLREQIHI